MHTRFKLQAYTCRLVARFVALAWALNGQFQTAIGQSAPVDDLNLARPTVHIVDVPVDVGPPPSPIFDPRQFGAKGDGITYDTAALQKAIDACAGTGGSVVLTPGQYVSAPLTLHGRMTLFLQKGSVLLGSAKLEDYPLMSQTIPANPAVNTHCHCLLYAYKADGLTLDGEGAIDGQCQEMNLPANLRKPGTESKRPSLICIFRSRNVTVRNVTLRNPCMWTQIYSECDNLLIDHIAVNAPPDCANLDGMDICDSRDVIIRNCDVKSEDDSICLKSQNSRGLKNILIENNRIRSYRANAIKLGTATKGPVTDVEITNNLVTYAKYAGLCIESVDGSDVRHFEVSGLDMYRVNNPIFIRMGNRSGHLGSLTDVLIENVHAYETGMPSMDVPRTNVPAPPSCTISGIPRARIGSVRLRNCYLEMPGGQDKIPRTPSEKEKEYPQSTVLGVVPAYGLYVRHAEDVVLDHVYCGRYQPDARPWLKADDAKVTQTACRDLEQIKPAATLITR